MMKRKTVRSLAALSIFLPILAVEAQDVDVPGNLTMRDSTVPAYLWTEIVIPGATVLQAWQINDQGQVALTTTDGPSGIYRNGTFTPLPPPPEGIQVAALGINNDGVITGGTFGAPTQQGFILHGSTYTFFSRPGWDNTAPRAIANSGLITGYSYSVVFGTFAGFVYDPDTSTFTDATPPGSTNTITQGMNGFGRITGHGSDNINGHYGFVWQQRTITEGKRELRPFLARLKIDVDNTNTRGINDSGVVVGFTTNLAGTSDGFVGNDALGYQRLVAPGGEIAGNSTFCSSINNLAQVVCYVFGSEGPLGGFIGSPSEGAGAAKSLPTQKPDSRRVSFRKSAAPLPRQAP